MAHSVVEMHFADGSVISSWETLSIRESFTDPLGSYEFTLSPNRSNVEFYRDRLKRGELVAILINGAPQAVPIIQEVKKTIGRDGISYAVTCNSVLVTPYQGSVDPDISKRYQSDTPITQVVLEAMAPYGLNRIVADASANRAAMSGKALTGGAPDILVEELKHKDAQAQDGETAYGFCSRIYSRFGVALKVNAQGVLILEAPDYEQESGYTIVQDFDGHIKGDRFLDGIEIMESNDDQFSEVRIRGAAPDTDGQTRAANPSNTVTAIALNPLRPQYQSSVAPYKPRIVKDKLSRDAKRCGSIAKLAMGMRAHKAFTVTGEVDNLVSKTGRVWTVGTMCRVIVEADGIDEDMFLFERTFTQSTQDGQRAKLKFLPKGSLVLGDSQS